MSLENQEILVKVIVWIAGFYILWKRVRRPLLESVSRAFLKAGNVKMAMRLRPKNTSTCDSDCSCPSTEK